jgi:hypothetical protein
MNNVYVLTLLNVNVSIAELQVIFQGGSSFITIDLGAAGKRTRAKIKE